MIRRGRAGVKRKRVAESPAAKRKRVAESAAAKYEFAVAPKRLLLDTHAWLWWRVDDTRLGPTAREAIGAASEVRFSAASAWEIAIKTALGKLKFPRVDLIAEELDQRGFRALPIEVGHAIAVAALPKVHGDPFDRMLVAQALMEDLTLVTADPTLAAYGVSVLSATD